MKRKLILEIEFANFTRIALYPAVHPRIPLEEQLETLRRYLVQTMDKQQVFSLEVEDGRGGTQISMLNRGNINAISAYIGSAEQVLESPPARPWEEKDPRRTPVAGRD